LEITTHSYSYIMHKLKALKIPWIALGGGGYDLLNTSRAWSIAWAEMNGIKLDPRLPAAFIKTIKPMGYPHRSLLDAMHWSDEHERNLALDAVEKSIARLKETVFPGILGTYGTITGE
jgi:acetoin utilization protein AcuC